MIARQLSGRSRPNPRTNLFDLAVDELGSRLPDAVPPPDSDERSFDLLRTFALNVHRTEAAAEPDEVTLLAFESHLRQYRQQQRLPSGADTPTSAPASRPPFRPAVRQCPICSGPHFFDQCELSDSARDVLRRWQ
ncbi:hypothetical protein HDU96_004736, partial [Phlyctochytrium bullatum]